MCAMVAEQCKGYQSMLLLCFTWESRQLGHQLLRTLPRQFRNPTGSILGLVEYEAVKKIGAKIHVSHRDYSSVQSFPTRNQQKIDQKKG